MFTRMICGHKVNKDLSNHLRKSHGLSNKEYQDMYPDSEVCSEEVKEHRRSNGIKTSHILWRTEAGSDFRARRSQCMTNTNNENWKNPEYREMMSERGKAQWTDEYRELKSKLAKDQWSNPDIKAKQIESLKDFYNSPEGLEAIRKKVRFKVEYNGVIYRSRWEVDLAHFLDIKRINYEYERVVIRYLDSSGRVRRYITDFYLRDYNLIIEVKPDYRIKYDDVQRKKEATELEGYRFMFVSHHFISGIREGSETIENELLSEIGVIH